MKRSPYRFLIIAGIFLVALAVLGAAVKFITGRTTDDYSERGVTVSATLTKAPYTAGRTRYVAYRFTAENKTCDSEDAYPFADWQNLQSGGQLDIVYLPGSCQSRVWQRQDMMRRDDLGHLSTEGILSLLLAGIVLLSAGYCFGRKTL